MNKTLHVVSNDDTVDGRNAAPILIHGKPCVVVVCRGIIIPGFLGLLKRLVAHPRKTALASLGLYGCRLAGAPSSKLRVGCGNPRRTLLG